VLFVVRIVVHENFDFLDQKRLKGNKKSKVSKQSLLISQIVVL